MNNNLLETVLAAIAGTQDGNLTSKHQCDFDDFISARVYANLLPSKKYVNVESLVSDFKYMREELKRALEPLEQFLNQYVDE